MSVIVVEMKEFKACGIKPECLVFSRCKARIHLPNRRDPCPLEEQRL